MEYQIIILVVFVLVGGIYLARKTFRRVTIYEYERGLLYDRGKYIKLLKDGVYWFNAYRTTINKVDIRPRYLTVPSQEVLTKDGIAVKMSLAASIEIADPSVAVNAVSNHEEAMYLVLQLALRAIIGTTEIDKLLEKRQELGSELFKSTNRKIEELGLKLISSDIKDVTFPGALKQTFAQVVKARHERLAALERARGETAALRNLANSTKMLENNPVLLQLRTP